MLRFLLVCVVAQAAAFSLTATRPHAVRHPAACSPILPAGQQRAASVVRHASPSMGLFGLGWGEIAIVGVIGLFLFGPDKLAPLAKDLGKSASGLKEVTDSFAEGMKEGNLQLDLKSAEEAVPAEAKEVEKPSSE